jgi:hypothetical protein
LANFASLVNQHVDAIVGSFDFAASMAGVGKQAEAAGIPVFAVANAIPNMTPGKGGEFTLGLSACDFGTNMVKSAVAATGKQTGTIGLYTGPPGNPFAAQWIPCATKAADEAGWARTLGYTQWTPQGMEQAASQLIASGKPLDAIASDLALSPGFMAKLLQSGQPVPVTAGASYTKQQIETCLSSPKFDCILGTSIGFLYRAAITAAVRDTHGQTVSALTPYPEKFLTVKQLTAQVDLSKLPDTGQLNFAISPELQTALAKDQ